MNGQIKLNAGLSAKDSPQEVSYPSAEMLLNVCMEDYKRLQNSYDKIYEKVNFALILAGVILGILPSHIDIALFQLPVKDMNLFELSLALLKEITSVGVIVLVFVATIRLLFLLRGRKVYCFNSEDIIDEKIYKEANEIAATWVMEKYTKIVAEMRPIVEEKQRKFNATIMLMIDGIILYFISVIL